MCGPSRALAGAPRPGRAQPPHAQGSTRAREGVWWAPRALPHAARVHAHRAALLVCMAAALLGRAAALPPGAVAAGGRRPGHLALRGGGKAAPPTEAPAAVALPPRGFIARSFDALVLETFEAIDTNKDGKVDVHEAHVLVLALYLKLNRQAPVEPPTLDLLQKLFKAVDTGSVRVYGACTQARPHMARAHTRSTQHTDRQTHTHTHTHTTHTFRQERQTLEGGVLQAGNKAVRDGLFPRGCPQVHHDCRRPTVCGICGAQDIGGRHVRDAV